MFIVYCSDNLEVLFQENIYRHQIHFLTTLLEQQMITQMI